MEEYRPAAATCIERIPRVFGLGVSSTCLALAVGFGIDATSANHTAHETGSTKVEATQSSYATEDFWAASGLIAASIATFIPTEAGAKRRNRNIKDSAALDQKSVEGVYLTHRGLLS